MTENQRMYARIFKRFFDLLLAVTGFVILLPLFLIITILFWLINKGQPFFIQPRVGKHERVFRLIKFRTMTNSRGADGQLLPDHVRLTKFGRAIRNSSLDELPQLLNVIAGDMSIIGPRPLLVEYIPHYNEEQRKRHLVRPGITGWAQVNGRNSISWQKKFEYDVWYVEHVSLGLDLKIIWLSVLKVVSAKDVNSSSTETMAKFSGN